MGKADPALGEQPDLKKIQATLSGTGGCADRRVSPTGAFP